MANNCYFEMKIAGREEAVNELVEMLQYKGRFKEIGLGRVYSFDAEEPVHMTPGSQFVSVMGYGDCAWSILCAMQAEYRKGLPSLESETERLGLVVEAFSSEPGCCFQEHILIDKGEPVWEECVDYEEHWISGMTEEEITDLCEEHNITRELLMKSLNDNGDYCVGGFEEDFGNFEDLSVYFKPELEHSNPSLDDKISSAAQRAGNGGNEAPVKATEQVIE